MPDTFKILNNTNFKDAKVSIDSEFIEAVFIPNVRLRKQIHFIPIWFDGYAYRSTWVSQFTDSSHKTINCCWLNGTWFNGGIICKYSNLDLMTTQVSPKSFHKPNKTLSLNYANYK